MVKLIIGLGNLNEYQFTPHNLGFLTIDRLAMNWASMLNRQCRALTSRTIGSESASGKPETFMNLSGLSCELVAKNEESAVD
jgi:PTH1 family peptidyl-tRNA hydrolase